MSSKEWRDTILSWSTAELLRRNGPELVASQLQSTLREERERIERHADELFVLARANRQGLALYRLTVEAARKGRKTLRVSEVLAAFDAEAD